MQRHALYCGGNGTARLIRAVLTALAVSVATTVQAVEPKARHFEAPPALDLTPELMAEAMRRTLSEPPTEEELRVRAWLSEHDHSVGPPPPAEPTQQTEPEEITDPPTVVQAFNYAPRMTRNFIVTDQFEAGGSPPDPDTAVGPAHVGTIVNFRIKFFTKSGAEVFNSSLFSFFQLTAEAGPFDPRIVYDEASGRFFALALGRFDQCNVQSWWYVGVSQSSDPTQGWWIYRLRNEYEGHWVDYPSLGVSNRAVYLCAQYVPNGSCQPPNTRYNTNWVLSKTPMLSGQGIAGWITDDLIDQAGFAHRQIRASVTYGIPSGAEAFLLTLPGGLIGGESKCVVWGVNLPANFPTTEHSFTSRSITIPTPPGAPVQAQQKGGPGLINVNLAGSPALDAVYQNGRLWTCSHYLAGGTPARDLLRYFEVNVSSWPNVSLTRTATFWDGSSFYFWPDITANHHGDVVVVFSRSRREAGPDPGEYPGSRWSVRLADETVFNASNWLVPGEHYYGDEVNDPPTNPPVYRWGDYSGSAVDPVSHGFWIFHEYSFEDPDNPDLGRWRTMLGFIPRAVFVDRAYGGTEAGTRTRPFNSVSEGHAAALPGNDLVIRAGSYPETTTLNKEVTILADGGLVRIGG